jgi:hypothetical protein
MAFTKLQWLAYVDQAVGFQSINLLQANLLEHLDVLARQHGQREPLAFNQFTVGAQVPAPQAFGNHNDPRIPRAMQRLSVVQVSLGSGVPTLGRAENPSVVTSFERTATGKFFCGVIDLDSFFADPVPSTSGAGVIRRVNATSVFANQQGPGLPVLPSGVLFESFELVAGVFTPADFDFSFAIYGTA